MGELDTMANMMILPFLKSEQSLLLNSARVTNGPI